MRILVVTNMYPTEDEPWYGCFVREQVDALNRAGVETEVLFFDGRRSALNYLRAAADVRQRVEREDFDLVHAHYGLVGAVCVAQRRVPVVTTFHGSDTGYVAWQQPVSWIVARMTCPVFVARANAARLGVRDPTVVPTAVDPDHFAPREREEARASLGWRTDAKYALFPGSRINPVKRVDRFREAVALAQESVGDLIPVYLEGWTRQQVATVMNAVDVVVMTSDSEGSPAVVKEALACATPVVSVPVGDVSETIRGLPSCAAIPWDPRDFSRAIVAAVDSPRHAALRERALEYRSDVIASRLVEIYAQVLERARG